MCPAYCADADDEHEPAFDLPFAGDKAHGRTQKAMQLQSMQARFASTGGASTSSA